MTGLIKGCFCIAPFTGAGDFFQAIGIQELPSTCCNLALKVRISVSDQPHVMVTSSSGTSNTSGRGGEKWKGASVYRKNCSLPSGMGSPWAIYQYAVALQRCMNTRARTTDDLKPIGVVTWSW